jgi:magnesium chelatase family protein
MLAQVYSAALRGIEAYPVKVEVDVLSRGLPGLSMVGLLETAVKEAKDRVGSAIRNSGYKLPNRKTVISLSPADLRKAGAHFDLPIAIALLAAFGVCEKANVSRYMIAGELALSGRVLKVNGAILMAAKAKRMGLDGIIVPHDNAWEAALALDDGIVPVSSLADAVSFLNGEKDAMSISMPHHDERVAEPGADLSEVRGQPFAKRGIEIAAAGGHNIALAGPPGTGKTMLAERLPSILPPLTPQEALEVLKIRSCHGLLGKAHALPTERPFRAPHHSASYAGLVGGGQAGSPTLGEISLAHNGVLFLDEMAEFKKDVLEVLRQPMESGSVNIVRSGVNVSYPARFMLVAAFNPCRCGYLTHPKLSCTCGVVDVRRYRAKLSGPLLDRIDLHVEVSPPPHAALIDTSNEEPSSSVRERVLGARERQRRRYVDSCATNAQLKGRAIQRHCALDAECRSFLKDACASSHLTGRAVHRVLKVARTIADLEGSDAIAISHLAEALQFRPSLSDL